MENEIIIPEHKAIDNTNCKKGFNVLGINDMCLVPVTSAPRQARDKDAGEVHGHIWIQGRILNIFFFNFLFPEKK